MLKRALLLLFLVLTGFIVNAFLNPIPTRKVPEGFKPQYGVSYSFEQALWYGLDPHKSYIDLIENVHFSWIRLPFFWNQMVDKNGNFNKNFDDLKFAIEEAQRRNIKVIIALGTKTPYFPEYHWPDEVARKVQFGKKIDANQPAAQDILTISRKVVEELAKYDNIIYWQVENEPLIGNVNKWKIDPRLIAQEVAIVRQTDPKKRPIILNHAAVGFYDSSWHQLLPILKPGDVFAVNAFFKTKGTDLITANLFGREIHVLWPDHLVWPVHSWLIFSPNFEAIKNKVEANGNEFWVLEMQAEPYIKKIDEARDPILSFEPQDIEKANNYLKAARIDSIGLWGAHFWQYKQQKGDSTWIEAVGQIVN